MAHKHSLYDTDPHYVIDPITKEITTESPKVKLMQYDHNSERFTFEIPRCVDGHDMSLCNKVMIHFNNAAADKTGINKDAHTVDDMQLSPDDENIVIFSWLVSQNATQLAGMLSFSVCFSCIADDGTVEYAWHSDIYAGITISAGIHNDEAIIERYSDVLEEWRRELFATGAASTYTGTPDISWYDEMETTFTLTSADQLYGFAQLVNSGYNFMGQTVKLGVDMVVNYGNASTWGEKAPEYKWTPIGAPVVEGTSWKFKNYFAGTLDGQGHFISGLYNKQGRDNGFMCYTFKATIENLAIINSYFENDSEGSAKEGDAQVLAAFVGRGYGIVASNLYSDAILVCSGKDYHTGGIIGFAKSCGQQKDAYGEYHDYNDASINSVVFAGTIKSNISSSGSLLGGILGGTDNSYATVKNSLFVGAIDTNDNIVGGIAGRISEYTRIDDCVIAGIINNAEGKTAGAVVGQLYYTVGGEFNIHDCYYAEDLGLELVGAKTGAADDGFNESGNEKLKPVQMAILRWWKVLG